MIRGATGHVGKELVRQIVENPDCSPLRHKNPTMIVGLESHRRGAIYLENGIKDCDAIRFSEGKIDGFKCQNDSQLLSLLRSPTVIVDVTSGGEELRDFHLHVIGRTKHSIVTANKYPLTLCTFEQFGKLTDDYSRYGFSCSVMAGAGTIHFLRNCPDLNDHVIKIQGCMSGTLGYIPNRLEGGQKFSEIVREARGKYTEPHPARDLDGGDVVRKALILARTAGLDVSPDNIRVTPFIPREYLVEEDVERFLANLARLDEFFERTVGEAQAIGKVLRYVATVLTGTETGTQIVVGPELVDRDSKLGSLHGTDNKVTIWTRTYGMHTSGWTLGPVAGAGNDITARNIRDNLLDSLSGRRARPEA